MGVELKWETWDGFGINRMDMGCTCNAYGTNIKWILDGCGTDMEWARGGYGMNVEWMWTIGMTSNGYGIDTGCTWIDMGERTWNVCNGHEIDVEWAWNAHRMDMEMIWDEHGMDMGD